MGGLEVWRLGGRRDAITITCAASTVTAYLNASVITNPIYGTIIIVPRLTSLAVAKH